MHGITVTLYEKQDTGTDPFGNTIWEETPVRVDDVLIGEPSTDDITSSTQLYGKVIRYMLGIPKGDRHTWEDSRIEWTDAYGTLHRVRSFGTSITGIEANIPTRWHKKVRCEDYGESTEEI